MTSLPLLPTRGLRLTTRFASWLALLTGLFLLWAAWQRWLAMQPGATMGQKSGDLSPGAYALWGVACLIAGIVLPGHTRRRYAAALARRKASSAPH